MPLKITIADNAGFCYGVMRAIKMAENAIDKYKKMYSLGPIIHNPQVVEEYEKKGLKVLEDLEDADAPILIRSHGVPPEVYNKIKDKNIDYIDATCPFVKEAQDYAREMYNEGYTIVIFGDKNHPEVKAHLGYANYNAYIIDNPEDAKQIFSDKIGVISQTTQSVENFAKTVAELSKNAKQIKVYNTICDATEKRQESAEELSKKSDIMIVIGGKNSANTRKLYEICRQYCEKSYHIETESEIEIGWFEGVERVGITAGASTPSYMIERVYNYIKGIDAKKLS
jgi:4-hydroxy-3-methylbut-2-enyl diphosphate reductase